MPPVPPAPKSLRSRPGPDALAARDPATDIERLLALLETNCHDVLLNPVFLMIPVLHGDGCFRGLGYSLRQRLSSHWLTPSFVLAAITIEPYPVAAHPRCPAELLPRLLFAMGGGARPERDLVLSELSLALADLLPSPMTSQKVLLEIPPAAAREAAGKAAARLAASPVEGARVYAAGHPLTPPDDLARLAADPSAAVRSRLCINPAAPVELLLGAIERDEARGMALMAGDPQLRAEAARALARCGRVHVRMTLAEHPSLDLELLGELARDPSWLVRRSVAWNVCAPAELLERLAGDGRREVGEEARWRASLAAA